MIDLRVIKIIILCFLWTAVAIIGGCATSSNMLYINQTYRAQQIVPLSDETVIALNSGETIDLKKIARQEEKMPARVRVIKVHGTFLVTGDGMAKIWKIVPEEEDKAKFSKLSLLSADVLFSRPKFKGSFNSNCVKFYWQERGQRRMVFIDSQGNWDQDKCPAD